MKWHRVSSLPPELQDTLSREIAVRIRVALHGVQYAKVPNQYEEAATQAALSSSLAGLSFVLEELHRAAEDKAFARAASLADTPPSGGVVTSPTTPPTPSPVEEPRHPAVEDAILEHTSEATPTLPPRPAKAPVGPDPTEKLLILSGVPDGTVAERELRDAGYAKLRPPGMWEKRVPVERLKEELAFARPRCKSIEQKTPMRKGGA